jgi:hypothetical protein
MSPLVLAMVVAILRPGTGQRIRKDRSIPADKNGQTRFEEK